MSEPESPGHTSRIDGKPLRVWVVDDSPADRHLMKRALRPKIDPAQVTGFGSSEEALVRLEEGTSPNLVLLDLNMPGLGGMHFLRERKARSFRYFPVVVFSSSSDRREIQEVYALGASSYVRKPDDLTGLRALCAVLLDYWFRWAVLP
ncbi:MAG: response regulator [Sandaracinaceae bacterium]